MGSMAERRVVVAVSRFVRGWLASEMHRELAQDIIPQSRYRCSTMVMRFDDADHIFKCPKRLKKPLRWESIPKNNSASEHCRRLECRVEIDGGIRRGVFFRIIVYPGSLTRVTFQLETEQANGRSRGVLYRFELNPLRPHTNKLYGPDEVNGLRIDAGVPHEHVFYDSLSSDGCLRKRCDEQGRIVHDPPEDFPTALAYVCRRINLLNGSDVPNPGDQGLLL